MSDIMDLGVSALVFDVQGTLLDFFTPVRRAVVDAFVQAGVEQDPDPFVNAWRATYFAGADAVTKGGRPYVPTSTIYREGLDQTLAAHDLERAFPDQARDDLAAVWSHLEPWPDTVEGLRRLRRRYVLAALSNGGMGSTIDMTARHDLGFHAILTGELVASYKPAPKTYQLAIDSLARPPETLMMVASHPYDLQAARSHGMRTAFIHRPLEFGPATPNPAEPPEGTDIVADDILELARLLGAGRVFDT